MIPSLRTRGEKILRGLIDRWIVQTACLQTKNIGPSSDLYRHLAAAGRAEAALDRVPATSYDFVIAWLAAKPHRSARDRQDGGIGAPIRALAISAVAVQHEDRVSLALEANGATGAPAGQKLRHEEISELASKYGLFLVFTQSA
jgi:hypothetical protein